MKTIIPAQPGFFAVYPNGKADPIIAWELTPDAGVLGYIVWPITVGGAAGEDHEVKCANEYALPIRGAK